MELSVYLGKDKSNKLDYEQPLSEGTLVRESRPSPAAVCIGVNDELR